jgi:glycerophosphoryl diester phosphodiesterase
VTQILGHRGHPRCENTLRGLDACLAAGLDGAEIDVQLLADSTVVVFHDHDLRRLAGDPRKIAELHAADLAHVKVFGQPIPTLAQVLARWPDDRWLNVELKSGGVKSGGLGLVEATLGLLQGRANIVLSSFDPQMLAAASGSGACTHELALLLAPDSPAWLHADGGRSFGCRSVHLHAMLVAPRSIERYASLGLGVGCWGAVDRGHEQRLLDLGVMRIITDWIESRAAG